MIQANELRIGNRVSTNRGNGTISSIKGVDKEDMSYNKFSITVTLDYGDKYDVGEVYLIGLELSPNLFQSLGIKTKKANLYKKLKNIECIEFKYTINNNECPMFLVFINGLYNHVLPSYNNLECVFNPIQSLHQLQNLYFALTGTELDVNL
ncbi:MAG: hypothetical protein KH100_15790 [Dysgonomonas mossii]|uniref:hypothetical protein n=1 Tax=Dysgonomonas mossii TaxID=163665 RepID=UPI001DA922A3|nr:hypothetical protein [Dysgonomonas mossii]MBS5798108.1 hypothetical protein [Dysgonomonas mossii]MBS7112645.1 hypothetical protein [Dysgonomonas mossii]